MQDMSPSVLCAARGTFTPSLGCLASAGIPGGVQWCNNDIVIKVMAQMVDSRLL